MILELPSRTEFLSLARGVTMRLAEAAGFDDGVAARMGLAVDECVTNVIKHAYHGADDRAVEIRIDDVGRDFKVEVLDNGDTLDLKAIPRVDLATYAAERRRGGLGVHLMEKIMDSVTFSRLARRNVCRLVKRKPEEGSTGR